LRAAAYLRKSRVTSSRHVSWELQEAEVRALAARHGDTDLTILADWSRSGRATRHRPEFLRLRELVASGQVRVVYGYSLSRLARSLADYVKLAELCQEHGVPIRLAKEGDLDYSTVTGRLMVHILAAAAQAEAEWTMERTADAVRVRRERGDYLGVPPYGFKVKDGRLTVHSEEPIERIVEVFRQSGSFLGTAKVLNGEGVRSRRGKWSGKVVRDVLVRAGEAQRNGRSGLKPSAPWRLFRLLRDPLGHTLTATKPQHPLYFCTRARSDPDHPRPYSVAESLVMPWVMEEAGRLRIPLDTVRLAGDDERRRAELGGRRRRVLDNYEDGLLTKAERDAKLGLIDDAMMDLDAAAAVVVLPERVDWGSPPGDINAFLRAVFEGIDLGRDMRPVRAVWRVPAWRNLD